MISFLILVVALITFFTKRKGISLFLLITLTTGGFWIIGVVTTIFGASVRLTDLGLMYVIILLIYKLFRGDLQKLDGPFKILNYLLLFITISILLDMSLNNTPIGDIFRTSRNWLFFLVVYLVPSYTKEDIFYAFRLVFTVTTIELVLFLTEPLTGVVLFSTSGMLEALQMTNVTRYSMFPPLLFFLFVWTYTTPYLSKIYKNILIFLIFLAIVVTLIRSMVLALGFIVILSVFITSQQSLSKKIFVIFGILIFSLSISLYEPLSSRFTDSTSDISSIGKSKKVKGNMSYRILLASERLEHILKEPQKAIFGIGFITESNYKGHFIIGLRDKKNRVIQLDTADIAWAIFFLRLGLVGTFIYMIFYIGLMIFFWKNKTNFISLAGFYYMIIYFIWSLTGTAIASATFVLIPALLYQLIRYTEEETHIEVKVC